MAYNYINARIILDRLLDNPLLSDIREEHLIIHTVDFLRIVGIPGFFENKNQELTLTDGRVMLPSDFYEVDQIIDSEGTIDISTSNFHFSSKENSRKKKFFIQNGYIYFNFKKGTVILSYQAIPIDEDGLPLIPDNSNFIRALSDYIKLQKYTILFDTGKIQGQVLQNAQRDYA